MIEREVKLRFPDVEAARQAVLTAGARLVVVRRLIEDRLFDTRDGRLRGEDRALRVRRDGTRTLLTCKGPADGGRVKAREEVETAVADPHALDAILCALGYRETFRSEKYREEYAAKGVIIAVDETPMGVFVEIEGAEEAILDAAAALGRQPGDFVLESYPRLYRAWSAAHGTPAEAMTFGTRA